TPPGSATSWPCWRSPPQPPGAGPPGSARSSTSGPTDRRAQRTGSARAAHGLRDADGLLLGQLALQAQGQVAVLPDEGVAGQAGPLLAELAGGGPVGERGGAPR